MTSLVFNVEFIEKERTTTTRDVLLEISRLNNHFVEHNKMYGERVAAASVDVAQRPTAIMAWKGSSGTPYSMPTMTPQQFGAISFYGRTFGAGEWSVKIPQAAVSINYTILSFFDDLEDPLTKQLLNQGIRGLPKSWSVRVDISIPTTEHGRKMSLNELMSNLPNMLMESTKSSHGSSVLLKMDEFNISYELSFKMTTPNDGSAMFYF